jgi:DNA primase
MALPDSFVEEVRRTADIVRYISEHVALRKMGTSWKGLCPFHNEKTPSFNVRAEPAVFHCFGCGQGGDVFKFAMLHERVSFPEAIELVARRFGLTVPENRYEGGADRKEREELLGLLEAAAQHFTRNLWTAPGERARQYLLDRGFQQETLERIRAGAAREGWTDLADAMKRRFSDQALRSVGLVVQKEGTDRHYDRFRNRAVFPIFAEGGKVVAFGARSLDGSEPKYLNSPEGPVYQKSRVLYGLHWAKDAIRKDGRAVLMEGYLDVARALEHGVEGAVATCGTALTPAHARLLRRFTDRVVVNFDQDAAGQRAARKGLDVLLAEGFKVQVVELPEGHDPDSFLKQFGADAYRRRLDEAPGYMEWLIRRAALEHDTRTPSGKSEYLNALLPSLARIESAVERAAWMPAIVEAGGLDERAAQEELRRALTAGRDRMSLPDPQPARPTTAPQRARLHPAERMLVSLVVTNAEGIGEALLALSDECLDALGAGDVLAAARRLSAGGGALSAAALMEGLTDDDARRIVTEVAVEAAPQSGVSPADCVRELRRLELESRLLGLRQQIAAAKDGSEDALLREKNEIARQIAGL